MAKGLGEAEMTPENKEHNRFGKVQRQFGQQTWEKDQSTRDAAAYRSFAVTSM